jgi:hypothetical protein
MNLELVYWFCESCGTGYTVKPKRKMGLCWNCGTALERLSDAAELEYAILAYSPEPGDDEDDTEGKDDPSFTIPPE